MNYLFLVLLLIFGVSCSEDENIINGILISTGANITVVDNQGVDLLDPDTQNYFRSDNIKISHLVDGEIIEYFDGHLEYSHGFKIYNPYDLGFNDKYTLRLLATKAYGSYDLMPITYIQWNETDTDTMQCQISRTDNSTICKKVWYNGDLVWDYSVDNADNEERWFEIVK